MYDLDSFRFSYPPQKTRKKQTKKNPEAFNSGSRFVRKSEGGEKSWGRLTGYSIFQAVVMDWVEIWTLMNDLNLVFHPNTSRVRSFSKEMIR